MQDRDTEIKSLVEKSVPQFLIDLDLCAPASLGLDDDQIIMMFSTIQKQLPHHALVCDNLIVSLQASTNEDNASMTNGIQNVVATVLLYPPYSEGKKPLIAYTVCCNSMDIKIKEFSARPLNTTRKNSLFGYENDIILVIDDDPMVRIVMRQWLNVINPNCKVFFAEDGLRGLDLYKQYYHCSLIFMDYQMPYCLGDTAISLIRNFETERSLMKTKVIGISAKQFQDDHQFVLLCEQIIPKPLSKDAVEQVIRTHIDSDRNKGSDDEQTVDEKRQQSHYSPRLLSHTTNQKKKLNDSFDESLCQKKNSGFVSPQLSRL